MIHHFLTIVAIAVIVTPTTSQPSFRDSECQKEVRRVCPEAADATEAMECLERNAVHISERCRPVEHSAMACMAEAASFCSEATSPLQLIECLEHHRASADAECEQKLNNFPLIQCHDLIEQQCSGAKNLHTKIACAVRQPTDNENCLMSLTHHRQSMQWADRLFSSMSEHEANEEAPARQQHEGACDNEERQFCSETHLQMSVCLTHHHEHLGPTCKLALQNSLAFRCSSPISEFCSEFALETSDPRLLVDCLNLNINHVDVNCKCSLEYPGACEQMAMHSHDSHSHHAAASQSYDDMADDEDMDDDDMMHHHRWHKHQMHPAVAFSIGAIITMSLSGLLAYVRRRQATPEVEYRPFV